MILPSLPSILAKQSRDSLPEFVNQAWPVIEPHNPLLWNWHHDAICDALNSVRDGDIKRLIINIPPGFTKSLLVSVMFPTWIWADEPDKRFLMSSYSDKLTKRDNRSTREIVRSDIFQPNWNGERSKEWTERYNGPVRIVSTQDAKERFDNTAMGWRIATMMGGAGTGFHPHGMVLDDPLKASDWSSDNALDVCMENYDTTFAMRLGLDPWIIVIMQRLSEMDPSGVLWRRGGWETICFPMHYASRKVNKKDVRNIPDKRDIRTVEGELLWPEKFDEVKVKQMEDDLNIKAPGQLEQNPVPVEGAIVKRHWFNIVDEVPSGLVWCRGWDAAGTVEDNKAKAARARAVAAGGKEPNKTDATASCKMGVLFKEDTRMFKVYISHTTNDHFKSEVVDELMLSLAKSDGRRCKQREEREPGSSGKATTTWHGTMLAAFDYDEVVVGKKTGDKMERLAPFFGACRRGNVYILRRDDMSHERFIDRMLCLGLPGYADDDGDAVSCAFNSLVRGDDTVEAGVTW